jgi:hypothetical protein
VVVRPDCGLEAVAQPELGQEPGDVGFCRGLTDDESLGDLGVGQASGEEPGDVDLAGGEPLRL